MENLTFYKPGNVDKQLICSAAVTLGISRLAELLVVLEARIERLSAALITLPCDQADIIATLHQSRGSAATLGFTGLEGVLGDIETRLSSGAGNASCKLSDVRAPETGVASLSHQPVDALGEAWKASLTAAALHIPELRHHRPFGSRK